MKHTDISAPDYFHKVVDCQWACPAHTPVPEYIRLIAAGRYSDAYMVNWKSNVFPGILGRTCDRPCEPACRRGRVEKEPVAICRLKRVAADYKDDIRDRLPKPAAHKNGKRIALVGGGPASLDGRARPRAARLSLRGVRPGPEGRRHDPHADPALPPARNRSSTRNATTSSISASSFVGGKRIDSLKALLAEDWDAIFVGSGAPRGRDLDIPGRKEAAANIHIGIDWLSSVSFGHINKIGKRVIVLGGGNTAMDCCRSSRRLGGEDVKVIVRSGFEEMKASPWEKEDAMHEDIPILNFLVPKEFTHENGQLTGVDVREGEGRIRRQGPPQPGADRRAGPALSLRRRAGRGRPGERLPLDRARHRHRVRQVGHAEGRSQDHALDPSRRCSSAATPRSARRTSSGRSRTATTPRCRSTSSARGEDINDRPLPMVEIVSQKMGIHEWSYDNDIALDKRYRVPLRDKVVALRDIKAEVELGFDLELALKEAQRCLNCDVQTVFTSSLCIECDACVDICPMDCITFTENGEEADLRTRLQGARPRTSPRTSTSPTISRPAASW